MTLQLYRNTTIGICLQEALNEIRHSYQLPDELYYSTLTEFDKVIGDSLNTKVKTKLNISGKLLSYRFCDNVWTLIMTDAEFKDGFSSTYADKVKIVAIGSKSSQVINNGRQSTFSRYSSKRNKDSDSSDEDQKVKRYRNENT